MKLNYDEIWRKSVIPGFPPSLHKKELLAFLIEIGRPSSVLLLGGTVQSAIGLAQVVKSKGHLVIAETSSFQVERYAKESRSGISVVQKVDYNSIATKLFDVVFVDSLKNFRWSHRYFDLCKVGGTIGINGILNDSVDSMKVVWEALEEEPHVHKEFVTSPHDIGIGVLVKGKE